MSSALYQIEAYQHDGVTSLGDITHVTFEKKGSYRLSRPTIWTFKINSRTLPGLTKGCRIRVRRNGFLVFNGIVMFVQREGDENLSWCSITAIDPMIWWTKRVVRDETGDFSRPCFTAPASHPSTPSFRPISGAEILKRTITQSQANTTPGSDASPADVAEGTMWLNTTDGQFDTTLPPAVDLGTDDLTDWPMTIAELSSMLVNTGMIDIYLTPVEGGDPMAILNVVNQRGTDRSGTVHFDYGTGDFNVKALNHTEDLNTLCNKLWYYLGPAEGVQRYKANITMTETDLPDPPQTSLTALALASRLFYGVAMEVKIYDTGNEVALKDMYQRLWQTELLLRANGQELVQVTPKPDAEFLPFDDYDLGDEVTIHAGPVNGVEFSASQRIYGFDVMPDNEGVERVGALIASADQG